MIFDLYLQQRQQQTQQQNQEEEEENEDFVPLEQGQAAPYAPPVVSSPPQRQSAAGIREPQSTTSPSTSSPSAAAGNVKFSDMTQAVLAEQRARNPPAGGPGGAIYSPTLSYSPSSSGIPSPAGTFSPIAPPTAEEVNQRRIERDRLLAEEYPLYSEMLIQETLRGMYPSSLSVPVSTQEFVPPAALAEPIVAANAAFPSPVLPVPLPPSPAEVDAEREQSLLGLAFMASARSPMQTEQVPLPPSSGQVDSMRATRERGVLEQAFGAMSLEPQATLSQQTPSPPQQTPFFPQQTPSPPQRQPSPLQQTPSPPQRQLSPPQQAPSPQQTSSTPQRQPSPQQQTPVPPQRQPLRNANIPAFTSRIGTEGLAFGNVPADVQQRMFENLTVQEVPGAPQPREQSVVPEPPRIRQPSFYTFPQEIRYARQQAMAEGRLQDAPARPVDWEGASEFGTLQTRNAANAIRGLVVIPNTITMQQRLTKRPDYKAIPEEILNTPEAPFQAIAVDLRRERNNIEKGSNGIIRALAILHGVKQNIDNTRLGPYHDAVVRAVQNRYGAGSPEDLFVRGAITPEGYVFRILYDKMQWNKQRGSALRAGAWDFARNTCGAQLRENLRDVLVRSFGFPEDENLDSRVTVILDTITQSLQRCPNDEFTPTDQDMARSRQIAQLRRQPPPPSRGTGRGSGSGRGRGRGRGRGSGRPVPAPRLSQGVVPWHPPETAVRPLRNWYEDLVTNPTTRQNIDQSWYTPRNQVPYMATAPQPRFTPDIYSGISVFKLNDPVQAESYQGTQPFRRENADLGTIWERGVPRAIDRDRTNFQRLSNIARTTARNIPGATITPSYREFRRDTPMGRLQRLGLLSDRPVASAPPPYITPPRPSTVQSISSMPGTPGYGPITSFGVGVNAEQLAEDELVRSRARAEHERQIRQQEIEADERDLRRREQLMQRQNARRGFTKERQEREDRKERQQRERNENQSVSLETQVRRRQQKQQREQQRQQRRSEEEQDEEGNKYDFPGNFGPGEEPFYYPSDYESPPMPPSNPPSPPQQQQRQPQPQPQQPSEDEESEEDFPGNFGPGEQPFYAYMGYGVRSPLHGSLPSRSPSQSPSGSPGT